MVSEWEEKTLGDCLTLQRGFDLPARVRNSGTVPVISSAGLSGFHNEAKCEPPGIVTGRYGTLGQIFWVTTAYWPHNTALYVCDFKGNDARFLFYLLQGLNLGYHNDKSGVPGVNRNDLHRIEVLCPPVWEQRAIARILGALDDKIELNRQMTTTLEQMARSLFKSWFIDFDPVRAKAAGGQPCHMSSAVSSLFPNLFQLTKNGELPFGWEIRAVSDFVDGVFDGPHATPPVAESGAVFLGLKNLTGSQIDLSELRFISEADWPRWTKRITPATGDIVFTYEATIGAFALIPEGLRCCLGRRLALVRPNNYPHFLFHWFISDPFQETLINHTVHGSTVPRTSLLEFPNYAVLFPGEPLIEVFDRIASKIWLQIHSLQDETLKLRRTRDALLPQLLSGKIRLRQADKLVEEALT